jgi:hypothetical protein
MGAVPGAFNPVDTRGVLIRWGKEHDRMSLRTRKFWGNPLHKFSRL